MLRRKVTESHQQNINVRPQTTWQPMQLLSSPQPHLNYYFFYWIAKHLFVTLQKTCSYSAEASLLHFLKLLSLPTDNSISVLAKHDTFRRQKQEMYFLPIIVTDNGNPPMSSTNTLTIRVCGCSREGIVQSCNVEAYVLPIGLSMGALIAILACIILLLGKIILILNAIWLHLKNTDTQHW